MDPGTLSRTACLYGMEWLSCYTMNESMHIMNYHCLLHVPLLFNWNLHVHCVHIPYVLHV